MQRPAEDGPNDGDTQPDRETKKAGGDSASGLKGERRVMLARRGGDNAPYR